MMHFSPTQICAGVLLTVTSSVALAQTPRQPHTRHRRQFHPCRVRRRLYRNRGAGRLWQVHHYRELTLIDSRIVERANRDTLYSTGVFDLDAGPVTITLPDAGKRFMTMMVIDEDHYAFTVVYGPGTHTLTTEKIGTRYALAAIRILVDPTDPNDVAQVNALQDAIKVEQPGGPGA